MIDLKIDNNLLTNLIINNKIDLLNELLLKEGSIFKGRIVELKDNAVILNVAEYGLVEARLDIKSEFAIGDQIILQVKSYDNDKIFLKVLENIQTSQIKYNKENPMVKLLSELGIEKNEITIRLVENLMLHNLPLNKDTVVEAIKVLEKLIQIINSVDQENILLSEPSLSEEISLWDIDSLDIRRIQLITAESDNFINHEAVEKDLSNAIKEYVRNEIPLNDDTDLIKLTSFLVKNNIKPILRNLKYINMIDNNPEEFIKDIQELIKLFKNEKINSKDNLKDNEKEISEDIRIITTREENITTIKRIIDESVKDSKKDLGNIKEMENRLSFLKELSNNELFLMFFPINYGLSEKLEGLMTLLKERKRRGIGERLNILINLNTINLGKVRILCSLVGDAIKIRMSVREEDLDFFKSNEKKLIEKILTIGYSFKGIEYLVDKKISIIDTQTDKGLSSYILDLKV